MLPLMRRHVRGCALSYWSSHLMPLAKALGGRSASAGKAGQRLLAANCHTLEAQIWAALPAFASYPTDTAQARQSREVWHVAWIAASAFGKMRCPASPYPLSAMPRQLHNSFSPFVGRG